MSDDLAQRLREYAKADDLIEQERCDLLESAAEIERLRAEVDRLTLERDDLDAIRNRENDAGARYIAKLATERDGLREQHGRDSAELRRLCEARDEARRNVVELREDMRCAIVERDEVVSERDALRERIEKYEPTR